jgi:hypothetical protein
VHRIAPPQSPHHHNRITTLRNLNLADDDGGEEQDNAVIDLMRVYNSSGITEMCLDLISKGIEVRLCSQ